MEKLLACDIFCNVVDNYGDIGVCWRLAKQLSNEHGMAVRLFVDDLKSFKKLCPEINPELPVQHSRGVKVVHWKAEFRETPVADLVIEAFACELPERYIAAMASMREKPVWINLEYFSAEAWVEGCHGLPSPHPHLPLVKYFFFPGVTEKTGGMLLEGDLLKRRDTFEGDPEIVAAYWQSLGVEPEGTKVSLFSYENPVLHGLLDAWAESAAPVFCLVPEGKVLPQLGKFFGKEARVGDFFTRGRLHVKILPFVEQERYDEFLWACDINFIRGEDSCARAQWAAKPFVWHIYPQHDGVHLKKLRAFMDLYCEGLSPEAGRALRTLWEGWNGGASGEWGPAWNDFMAHRSEFRQHARAWAALQSRNNLALNLLDFFRKIGKIRAS